MDEILVDRFYTDVNLTTLVGNRLSPQQILNGTVYPSVAYLLDGETGEKCAGGQKNMNYDLVFMVEAKTKGEVNTIRDAIIERFDNWNYVSLLGHTDEFEKTSKTFVQIINFKINKKW